VVVFPRMVVPLLIGRPASVAAIEESLASGRSLFLCAQRNPEVDSPERGDLYDMGVTGNILQTLRMPDGTMKIVVEAIDRRALHQLYTEGAYEEAQVDESSAGVANSDAVKALVRLALTEFESYSRRGQRVAPEVVMSLKSVEEPDAFADMLCAHLPLNVSERQELLELADTQERLEKIAGVLARESELLGIEQKARERVREQMDRGHREFFLQEQLRAIQQELGQREEATDEFAEMRQFIKDAKMPAEVRQKALREMGRYERMPPLSPESSILRTYLEWIVEVPWTKRTRDSINLDRARKILDEDHYGLEKVKERILEFLAVRKLSKSTKGPVLCLVGAPGVGKTSLGKSVARAMGRKFVRVSLGGIRDEAEIRGHRRTYIGALPGRIVQSMKRCGVKNPVFMLDEVDKMSVDFRGDPSSALLEVLDPEQNTHFSDHYLEVDYDLHEVFFIATANSEYDIPDALLDRMEIVRLSGYTSFEKERIARLFLIPKQLKENGLTDKEIRFTKTGLDALLHHYTHEAGVREFERQIAAACRKVALQVVTGKKRAGRTTVDERWVDDKLGPPQYVDVLAELVPQIGVSTGLAWTVGGGDTLIIETTLTRGKGELKLTGQLGEVMQESAQAAYTYLRAAAKDLKIPTEFWKNSDMHLHVPEGAIPKDGPSAGVAMVISMLSSLRKKAPRAKLAMTGEITLRGRVLAVGGVKEKILAAHRAKMETVLLPVDNRKDLKEVPKEVRDDLTFVFVKSLDEVIEQAFRRVRAPKKKRKTS
ncbi:MAG: endopeptidase La, partial [Candidatus Hydrogenedentes bacterium]|nr:endopeptidase La [Candidatus Hydrogenedentota bacterium]